MTNRRKFFQLAAAGAAGASLAGQSRATASHYAIPPMAVPSLPIAGSKLRFPIHRIYCLGLNYPAHIKEGKMPSLPPFYFQKANDMIVENNSTVQYPALTHDLEHEIEQVVAIGRGGVNIRIDDAQDHVFGYALGLDMTRRDVQNGEYHHGLPWEGGKSFEQCAPCTAIHRVADVGHISKGRIQLSVNGKLRQDDDLRSMILNVPQAIAFISTSITLMPGDLIYMGTPAGTAPVVLGDVMVGTIENFETLTIKVG